MMKPRVSVAPQPAPDAKLFEIKILPATH